MKIPEPRKLPSGSWFVRVQVDGTSVCITKPTKKACLAEAAALKTGLKASAKKNAHTLSNAIDRYIEDRKNVLSPSTIRGYRCIQNQRFVTMMTRDVSSITQEQWQRAINLEAKLCSAKTLKNAWGFLSTVIHDQTGQRITVRLPQVVANDLPFLTAEQIPAFLQALHGSPYEIPILLALSSLRRSEILAMKWEDIDLAAGCLHVHGAAVWDENDELVYRKENKNSTSRRTVPFLIPQLREAVEKADRSGEYIIRCAPNVLRYNINKACRKAGLPEVGTHGLRRSFASLAYHLGIPEAVTMKAGGWADIYTMRKNYTKISEKDLTDQGSKYEDFFSKIVTKNCNEIKNT
jgi:integrase